MKNRLFTNEIRVEQDIVFVRQRARELCRMLGFDRQDQSRLATAVSEVARNAFQYAGGGVVEFSLHTEPNSTLEIAVQDKGQGISNLSDILGGRYQSKTGMGLASGWKSWVAPSSESCLRPWLSCFPFKGSSR